MAGSVNKAILVGRLGRDPELRSTQGNTPVCNFSLATDETWKDQTGQNQTKTEWHKVVVWGRQAEIANQYLSKGRLVYVEGRIQTRKYTDRDGAERYSTEVVVDMGGQMQLLDSRQGGGEQGMSQSRPQRPAAQPQAAAQPQQAAPQQSAPDYDSFDDDIPF